MDKLDSLLLGILIGVVITMMVIIPLFVVGKITISQETADDICFNLTSKAGVKAIPSVGNDKLICETPTFDSTNNILIKSNAEEIGK